MKENIFLIGQGPYLTSILYNGSDKAILFESESELNNSFGGGLKSLSIINENHGTIGVSLIQWNFCSLKDIIVSGLNADHAWSDAGIQIKGNFESISSGVGSYNNYIENIDIRFSAIGIKLLGPSCTETHIIKGRIYFCNIGISLDNADASIEFLNFSTMSSTYESSVLDGVGCKLVNKSKFTSIGSRFEYGFNAFEHEGSLYTNWTELFSIGDSISSSSYSNGYYDTIDMTSNTKNCIIIGRISGNLNNSISHKKIHLQNPNYDLISITANNSYSDVFEILNTSEDVSLFSIQRTGIYFTFNGSKINVLGNIPTSGSYTSGDLSLNKNCEPGAPLQYICVESGDPGKWAPNGIGYGSLAKTANFAITLGNNGYRYNNYGATSNIYGNLPEGQEGLIYNFRRESSYVLEIRPFGSESIRGGTSGSPLYINSDGGEIQLQWNSNNNIWEIQNYGASISF